MDWVLVDAPCSGTGTLRRNPDMKWKFDEEVLPRLIGQQRMIFEKALSFLKPDGYIVYATCSLLKEENQHQLEHFLSTYSLKLEGEAFQTLPTRGGMDGFFGVVLKRA
jgi:16S rRNA C967 or C1407 C5-methylase (RsmB/RsmF family)